MDSFFAGFARNIRLPWFPTCKLILRMIIFPMLRFLIAVPIVLSVVLSSCSRQPSYPPPQTSGEFAVIDVSSLKQDVPQFYTYKHNGKKISFFVLKLDKTILSFLDACATCYTHKQGYRQEKDAAVTCRYCNMRFSLYKLEKGIGGCYPIKIEGRIEKEKYRIPLSVLENAANKF